MEHNSVPYVHKMPAQNHAQNSPLNFVHAVKFAQFFCIFPTFRS